MKNLAHRIKDIARELRGPNDEGREIFNTLYSMGQDADVLTAALQRIADGSVFNPDPEKWLAPTEMAEFARAILAGEIEYYGD